MFRISTLIGRHSTGRFACPVLRRLTVGLTALTIIGCGGTARLHVRPTAAEPVAHAKAYPAAVTLSLDQELATYTPTARTTPYFAGNRGYDSIEVTYELGAAIAQTIENAVQRQFREVRRVSSDGCASGTEAAMAVGFAKPPTVRIRWVRGMVSEGGGALVEVAVALTLKRCDGTVVWRGVASGYASKEFVPSGFWATEPAVEQFQPAADEALADLSRNLDAALPKVSIDQLEVIQGKEVRP